MSKSAVNYRVLHWVSATGGDFSEIVPPLVGGDTQGGDEPDRRGTVGGDKLRQGGTQIFAGVATFFSRERSEGENFQQFFPASGASEKIFVNFLKIFLVFFIFLPFFRQNLPVPPLSPPC